MLVTLKAASQDSDPDGKASRFIGTHEKLGVVQEYAGTMTGVIEGAPYLRNDHVLSRFTDNIWSEMGRCINCHSPERNERQVKKHGEQMSWIVPHDPEATLERTENR